MTANYRSPSPAVQRDFISCAFRVSSFVLSSIPDSTSSPSALFFRFIEQLQYQALISGREPVKLLKLRVKPKVRDVSQLVIEQG